MMLQPETITLKNNNGIEAEISNLGATLLSLLVPDKNGKVVNVIAGLAQPEDYYSKSYLDDYNYLGATVGRWAGRISGGSFKVGDKVYNLHNENGVHLHGGKEGFDKKYWNIDKADRSSVALSYLSVHLEEGYPGDLQIYVTYELTEKDELKITYTATSDKTTPINLTNHAYFNLDGKGSILEHELELKSDKYVELNKDLLVTGKLIETKNTSRDFTVKSKIGREHFNGLDDVFVLNSHNTYKASISSSKTGIVMNVYTNQPTLVVYTPSQLPDLPYKSGVQYSKYSAICFEAESYPDAPNQPNFPSALLNPEETYVNETIFKFRIKS